MVVGTLPRKEHDPQLLQRKLRQRLTLKPGDISAQSVGGPANLVVPVQRLSKADECDIGGIGRRHVINSQFICWNLHLTCLVPASSNQKAPAVAEAFTVAKQRLLAQNMRHNGRAAATDVLRHGDVDAVDLRVTGFAAQLQRRFYNLVDAGCANRMAPRLEATHCLNR